MQVMPSTGWFDIQYSQLLMKFNCSALVKQVKEPTQSITWKNNHKKTTQASPYIWKHYLDFPAELSWFTTILTIHINETNIMMQNMSQTTTETYLHPL